MGAVTPKTNKTPLNRRLCELQGRSGSFEADTNNLSPPGIVPRFTGRPARSLVTTPTSQ